MYAKIYMLSCDPARADAMMAYYDSVITPAVQESEHHVGHHMVESDNGKWLLVSNYHSKAAAEAALPMVQELVKPMMEQFGVTLEVLAEGEVARSI